MKLPDKVYELMKWLVCIVIPALCTFYAFLADRTGLPYGSLVSEIGGAACAMLGIILGISTAEFRRTNDLRIIKKN